MMKKTICAIALASFTALPALAETSLRATGLVSTHKFHTLLEQEFLWWLVRADRYPACNQF